MGVAYRGVVYLHMHQSATSAAGWIIKMTQSRIVHVVTRMSISAVSEIQYNIFGEEIAI